MGANKPEAYGDYYAWGETQTKSNYEDDNYIHYDGTKETYKETYRNLGSDIAGTQYDVAHVKWGGSWVMPSKAQQDELEDNCTYTWTTINGVEGGKFTGKNGKSVFLPAAGWRSSGGLDLAGSYGSYWSSTQDPSRSAGAYDLHFTSGGVLYYSHRGYGRSVRPVSR